MSCMEIVSFQQKCRNNRWLSKFHKTGCHTLGIPKATNIRSLQEYTPHKIILGPFPQNGLKMSSRNGKENINKGEDRQLAGQISSTPFISIRDGLNKRVTFDMTDGMEQKIDKLMIMMGKLVTEDEGQNRPFKP